MLGKKGNVTAASPPAANHYYGNKVTGGARCVATMKNRGTNRKGKTRKNRELILDSICAKEKRKRRKGAYRGAAACGGESLFAARRRR